MTYHCIFLVPCMHASYKTSSEMLNTEFISKGQEIWETNGKLELVPWKLEHNIREMEEHLAKLTSLFEDMTVHPRGLSPLPHQQVLRPSVQTTSYPPHGTDRPNLRQPGPTAPPAFRTISRPTDQPSSSRVKPSGQKINKDKPRWDPIPTTYIELFPKLVKSGHIKPIQLVPLRPPFPR